MRKWVRNVTGRCATPLLHHAPPPTPTGLRAEAASASPGKPVLLLWFPSIIGGRLPGDPEGCSPVTFWEKNLVASVTEFGLDAMMQ